MKLEIGTLFLIVILTTAAAAQTRTLTVVSEPNAFVWIDNVNYGKTDAEGKLTLKTFAAGTHKIRVRAAGFKEAAQNLLAAQKSPLKIALVKTTDKAELLFQQAEEESDKEKAVELYERATKLRPGYAEAYLGTARAKSGLGDTDGALSAIRNARKARLNYPEASAVEGRIYKDDGREEDAVASFKRAIAEGRGFQPEARAGLGLIYREKAQGFGAAGDVDAEKEHYLLAAAELGKAAVQLAGAPDAVTIYQLLGDSYERAKMYREAIDVYREVLKIFPDSDDATMFRSFIVQLEKRIKEEQQ